MEKVNETQSLKQEAAEHAVKYVKSGMIVGLGHGTTAAFAVKHIARLLKTGGLSNILGIPCSIQVEDEAKHLGIHLSTLEEHPIIDVTIDGADTGCDRGRKERGAISHKKGIGEGEKGKKND